MNTKKLLILGSSYKRRNDIEDIPAIERYDGVFYRVTRKNIHGDNILVFVLTEDLKLINSKTKIPFTPPNGGTWNQSKKITHDKKYIEKMRKENTKILQDLCQENNIDQMFVAVGLEFRRGLPEFKVMNYNVILPHDGLGPTAKSLKEWLQNI